MKVVLVVLSGKVQQACDNLKALYPQGILEIIPRNEIEVGSFLSRLGSLRAKRPDVFAIATERLAWQRGQNLLMLFGAMAGASEVVMVDPHGGLRRESQSSLVMRAPTRLGRETALSAAIMNRTRRELKRLEKDVNSARPDLIATPRASYKPLRITYLRTTPAPGTQAGGAASHIKGVVAGLLQLGVDVQLISNDELVGLDGAKISTTKIDAEPWGITRGVFDINNNAVFTRNALPLIQDDPPDLIYQRYARFSWAGVVASMRTGRPLFLEYNGSEVWVGRHWDRVSMLDLLSRYERLNLAAATRIFVVSEVERKNLERAGVATEKIIVNPNGVDTGVFRPEVGGARVREELGIAGEELLVGFVGSFGPWHGVLALAEAIKLIPEKSLLRFLLVGAGALHEETQRLLRAEVETGRVIFTGAVEHEQIPALLDACDILVSPHIPLAEGAEFFGSPTKLFEYMAMGKAIVASRLGQIGEVLTHEETALLVEPGDVTQLSAAITRLSESRALREALGTAARQTACERHTWRRNTQNIVAAYDAWLKEPKEL